MQGAKTVRPPKTWTITAYVMGRGEQVELVRACVCACVLLREATKVANQSVFPGRPQAAEACIALS
jgi:hypothetical protein